MNGEKFNGHKKFEFSHKFLDFSSFLKNNRYGF